jgi:hypothetical protein
MTTTIIITSAIPMIIHSMICDIPCPPDGVVVDVVVTCVVVEVGRVVVVLVGVVVVTVVAGVVTVVAVVVTVVLVEVVVAVVVTTGTLPTTAN